jgi:CMP/dCMP kinase
LAGMVDLLSKKINIAIDGPAGAGKSTIAKIVSKTLGIIYLDTGAMYRTVALKAITEGVDTRDRDGLTSIINNIDVKISYEDNNQRIFLDGVEVTDKIRTPEISSGASNVAAFPEVRIKMVELQREIACQNSVVMDGRDIGTYVIPKADLKIFLTASLEERAKRRHNELFEKGVPTATLDEVKSDIANRDKNDSSRSFAPLVKAEDAVEIDTTQMSIEEVAQKITLLLKDKCERN